MSIKSSTLRRLSNGVVCVSRNCWERTLSIATLRKQHSHFDQVTLRMALFKSLPWPWLKLFSSTCSFLPLVLKKNRNQNSEYHGTFTPLRIQLYSKPESLIFLLLWSWRLVLYLYFYVKSKFFAIILVDVQRLHGNGKWILYVSNRAKCLSVCLRTKWLWDPSPLELLKFKSAPVSSKELIDLQANTECRFTLKRICDTIRTHSLKHYCCSTLFYHIKLFHLQQN